MNGVKHQSRKVDKDQIHRKKVKNLTKLAHSQSLRTLSIVRVFRSDEKLTLETTAL